MSATFYRDYILPQQSCYFEDASNVDWRERTGRFLMSGKLVREGYFRIDGKMQSHDVAVQKTISLAKRIFYCCLQWTRLENFGQWLLLRSATHRNKWEDFTRERIITQLSIMNAVINCYKDELEGNTLLSHESDADDDKNKKFVEQELISAQSFVKEVNNYYHYNIDAPCDSLQTVIQTIDKLLQRLQEKPTKVSMISLQNPMGFPNITNSCYINAALQPILNAMAKVQHDNGRNPIPDEITQNVEETDNEFRHRKTLLEAIRRFVSSWQDKDRTIEKIGQAIAKLRQAMYDSGLTHQESIIGQNCAGTIAQALLSATGNKYTQILTKTFINLSDKRESQTRLPEHCLLLGRCQGSIQERINQYAVPLQGCLNNPTVDGFTNFEETNHIENLPTILLVDVKTLNGRNAIQYPVTENDLFVDGSALLEKPPEIGSNNKYELVGFMQNHREAHWTSVVKGGDGHWYYCNDHKVWKIDPKSSEFNLPASYLVYRKLPSFSFSR